MMENNTTTRQPVSAVSVDGTIHRHRTVVFLSNFRSCPALSAPISFNLHGFILNLDSYVEIYDLQIEIAITNKIVGFDVSMRNSVFMEICESLDEASTESDTTSGTNGAIFIQGPLAGN